MGEGLAVVPAAPPRRRPLPEDPKALEEALKSTRIMARTVVVCLNKLNEVAGVSRFDKDEEDTLAMGVGALMYEEGAQLSGRTLCALALAGVYTPRVAEKVDQLAKRKRERAEAQANFQRSGGIPVPPPPSGGKAA